jgi:anti-sigma-K factor RskA
MPGEDDLELLAAEYALGVLSGEERTAVERRLV